MRSGRKQEITIEFLLDSWNGLSLLASRKGSRKVLLQTMALFGNLSSSIRPGDDLMTTFTDDFLNYFDDDFYHQDFFA